MSKLSEESKILQVARYLDTGRLWLLAMYQKIWSNFLLTGVTQRDVEYLYRLFSSQPRGNKPRSFIICSQIMKDEMYTRLSNISPSLANAIINRISARTYEFEIQGDSMRKVDIPAELHRIRESKVQ